VKTLSVVWLLIVTAATTLTIGNTLAGENAPATRLELVTAQDGRPLRLELAVTVDDQPLEMLWERAFDKLFEFADVDGNRQLSEVEAKRLPTTFGIRQLLWGKLDVQAGDPPPLTELDTDGDHFVSQAELAAWYRRAGFRQPTIGVGVAPGTALFTEAMVRALDINGDSIVTEQECQQAIGLLRKLDANDDELVSPGELVTNATYPGTAGTRLLRALASQTLANASSSPPFPWILLPADPAQSAWADELARRLIAGENGSGNSLNKSELLAWRNQPADITWRVSLRSAEREKFAASEQAGSQDWSRAGLYLAMRVDSGRMTPQLTAAREQLQKQFDSADTNRDGKVTLEEATAQIPSPLKPFVVAVDRNGDGGLSKEELDAWLEVQLAFSRAHVLVTLLDCGEGLLEALDTDHDGALCYRELRAAHSRLAELGCFVDGKLDPARLPRHFIVIASRGQPLAPLGRPSRPGPAWFNAMDRNGDGDVSRREFTGPIEVFDRLDRDQNGLLSPNEAIEAQGK
jgi:hypothetical protein